MIDHHSALIYIMVLVSAADADMTDDELAAIGENVRYLPVFRDFDAERLPKVTAACTALLNADGLEKTLDVIKDALPAKLLETAYAVACDVAAADSTATPEELRLIELLRLQLGVDRLTAAAIERGAQARYARL